MAASGPLALGGAGTCDRGVEIGARTFADLADELARGRIENLAPISAAELNTALDGRLL